MISSAIFAALLLLPQAGVPLPRGYVDAFADAQAHLEAGRLEKARAAFEECLKFEPGNSICAYQMACCFAREKDDSSALSWLTRAVDGGWDDAEVALWDSDFAAYHDVDGFRTQVERMRKSSARRTSVDSWQLEPVSEAASQDFLNATPAVSRDGRLIALPVKDGIVDAIDLATGIRSCRWLVPPQTIALMWREDGQLLTLSQCEGVDSKSELCVWPPVSGQPLQRWTAVHVSEFRRECLFRPDGRRAFTSGRAPVGQLWNCDTAELAGTIDVGPARITACAWSDDSRLLAIGTTRGEVWILDASSVQPARVLWAYTPPSHAMPRSIRALDFFPDGSRLAIGLDENLHRREEDPSLLLIGVPAGEVLLRKDASAGNWADDTVCGLEYLRNELGLVSAGVGDVFLWDLEKSALRWHWASEECGDERGASFLVTSDQRFVAAWGNKCREGLFELAGGTLKTEEPGRQWRSWAESAELGLLISVEGQRLRVLSARTLDLRYERLQIGFANEVARVPSFYVDGTCGAMRAARVLRPGPGSTLLAHLAPRLWDPKRVRAELAGVDVLPLRAP